MMIKSHLILSFYGTKYPTVVNHQRIRNLREIINARIYKIELIFDIVQDFFSNYLRFEI